MRADCRRSKQSASFTSDSSFLQTAKVESQLQVATGLVCSSSCCRLGCSCCCRGGCRPRCRRRSFSCRRRNCDAYQRSQRTEVSRGRRACESAYRASSAIDQPNPSPSPGTSSDSYSSSGGGKSFPCVQIVVEQILPAPEARGQNLFTLQAKKARD